MNFRIKDEGIGTAGVGGLGLRAAGFREFGRVEDGFGIVRDLATEL